MDDVDEYTHIDISAEELGVGSLARDGCFAAKQALDVLDANWYNRTSQLGRWMDIVGDYAGEELILLEGDSLLGVVLNDPLLALARENDNSFQFLHARYSLERALLAYRKRGAIFEVVFFEDHRHVTYCTGAAEFVSASRILARKFLKRSLQELQIPTHTFQNLSDSEWDEFYINRKPMLVVTDDGGSVEEDTNLKAARALTLRTFIFDLLTSGISVALMRGTEFKDSKIFSFIYEQRPIRDARSTLDCKVWKALSQAIASLAARSSAKVVASPACDRAGWLCSSARALLSVTGLNKTLSRPLLYVFIAHAVALDRLPIQLRAQPLPALPSALEGHLRDSFLPQLFLCLESSMPESTTFRDIDLDGRIFLQLLQIFGSNSFTEHNMADILSPSTALKVTILWKTLCIPAAFSALSSQFHGFVPQACTTSVRDRTSLSVLPFSHPIFDEHLKPVHVDVDASSPPGRPRGHFEFGSGLKTLFEDKMHWHNSKRAILPKHLGGDNKSEVSDARARNRALKRNQFFHAGLQRQAQSLTGALGKPLERIVIAPVGTKSLQKKSTKSPQVLTVSRSSKKGSSQKLTSVERTRLQIKDQKQTKKDSDDSSWWSKTLLDIEGLPSIEARIQKTELLLRNPRTAEGWLAAEIRLYRLHLEIRAWIYHPQSVDDTIANREDMSIMDKFRVSILKMTQDPHIREFPSSAGILAPVLAALGFKDLAPALPVTESKKASQRKLSFEFVKVIKKSGSLVHKFMRLEELPINWMLRCYGDHMDRSLNSSPDRRVPFEPDGWQRKVLDNLDEDNSVLVVAPTSAGKTFISYYAMERVLRASDDGILVYVAPTKALVTQIAAEVSARYSKDIDGRSCWAVHTRDYRIHDPQKCQILITVPEVLAIMLLSPTLARVWTPRLRRIILDEIHSIGQEEGGSVWEQILLLAPCPIIGLSATVGEPQQFNDWLSSVQSAHHFKHTFIQHPHRYSHLRKLFYLHAKDRKAFDGLSKHMQTGRLRSMHPVCMLASGMARGLPPDFALEAKDCLSLFQALKAEAHAIEPRKLEDLDPETNFPHDRVIKQEDVLLYETKLKIILDELISAPRSHEASSMLQSVVRRLSDPVLAETPEHILAIPPRLTAMEEDFINVMSDLHNQGDLPALIFSFDRNQCERLAQRLVATLEDAETAWRTTSVEWRNKLEAWDLYQAKAKERERLKERIRRQRPDEDEVGGPSPIDDMSFRWEASFDPSDPSPDFSFAGVKTSFDKASLKEELEGLGWTSTPEWALQAIKRGIAVHHSGMNRKYRNLVEALFRIGFLRIVIATGTLALGINAPHQENGPKLI